MGKLIKLSYNSLVGFPWNDNKKNLCAQEPLDKDLDRLNKYL